jgi:protein tyrosine phosphatase (PTP) superfamily phosphohydrolase (DUF442 family)
MRSPIGSGVLARPLVIAAAVIVQAAIGAPAITIKNFGRINDRYYRGAQPKAQEYQQLAALGIKSIIDLTETESSGESQLAQQAGMKVIHIPMSTASRPKPAAVATFLRAVTTAANQPVFVHCDGGQHRTGAMTAIYRITMDHWNATQAFAEMERYHFGSATDHPALKNFVDDYDARAGRPSPSDR